MLLSGVFRGQGGQTCIRKGGLLAGPLARTTGRPHPTPSPLWAPGLASLGVLQLDSEGVGGDS